MPRATRVEGGEIEDCERTLRQLEGEIDTTLDSFITSAEKAQGFRAAIQKIELQLEAAEKLQRAENDLQLNESVIIAEKLEREITYADELATGAAVSETQDEWAEEFESAREALDRMGLKMKKAKVGAASGEAMETRSALLSFRRDSAVCKKKLALLKGFLSDTKNPAYAKVKKAKARLAKLKSSVGTIFSKMARGRLKKRIAEARGEIAAFMQKASTGKVFVDNRHLTLTCEKQVARVPLTEAVGFALVDLAPQMEKSLARVARGEAFLVGTYALEGGERVLRIGERTVAGDAIIYREKSFKVNLF